MLGLQRRLYLQLLKDSMPKKSEGSLPGQHAALTDALSGKTMLLAIDGRDDLFNKLNFDWRHFLADCWDVEHCKYIDVVDPSAGSKILVSSRISGLLSGSTEIKLSLLSISESVEMLSHAAGLDSAELSASLVEVAKCCGRLPLCLNIAARMIADCGDIEEVIRSLVPNHDSPLICLGYRYCPTCELATAGRATLPKETAFKILS
jgi:hypothetical protein